MTARQQLRYGDRPSQYVDLWLPSAPTKRGLAIALHGGWWRARHDLHLMDGLCADLADNGWFVANVEYRRIDGDEGGWPETLQDVIAGIKAAKDAATTDSETRCVAIGHSAGGHLALMSLAAKAVTEAIALAPITDLPRCFDEELGEGATLPFIGTTPASDPQSFRDASPIHQLPLRATHLVIHGEQDDRVPVQHSRDYVLAARAAGDVVDFVEIENADHFNVIDPAHPSWGEARQWLNSRLADSVS